MIPILSNMLMSTFFGAKSRRRGLTSKGQNSTERVTGKVWAEVAASRGLELVPGAGLMIEGAIQGVPCLVSLQDFGDRLETQLAAERQNGSTGKLRVVPRSAGRAVAAKLSGSAARTGEAEFDTAFVVLADPPEIAVRSLEPTVRRILLDLSARNPDLRVAGTGCTLAYEGVELDRELFTAAIDLVVAMARGVTPPAYRAAG